MSAKVQGWVWDLDLAPQPKLLLLWLANRATDAGVCFPTKRELGKRSSARIDGRTASPAQLRELGRSLVALHGQHEHHALLDIDTQTEQLDVSTNMPVDRWIFHMSVAYCSELSLSDWHELASAVETLHVPPMQCTVEATEVVAFDDGREYSGGTYRLGAQ